VDGLLDGFEERERHRAEFDLELEVDAGRGGRFDAEAHGGEERVGGLRDVLDGGAGAEGPFDADDGGFAEGDVQAVLVGEGGADDLLLDFAVEGDGEFASGLVVAQADERVLFGELGERGVERGPVAAGGAKCSLRSLGVRPIASPMRTSPRPQNLAIRPASTREAGWSVPSSNTERAVTLASRSPTAMRSRTPTLPENRRA
jgi:hypothetical protein